MGQPHPDVTRLVARFARQGVRRYDELGVLRSRSVIEGVTLLQREPVPLASIREVLVPGPAGLLPVRIYHPDPGQSLPLVVYLHGGGWTIGSVRAADRPCRRLAFEAHCAIASVEYRLAPETKFPGPLEDCVAAVVWLADHAEELGGGEGLHLMGDSAGANLAAAAALLLRQTVMLERQILIYPCLRPPRDTPYESYRENAEGPLMTRRELEWFWANYLRDEGDERDPRAAPLQAVNLAGVAPASIVVAELDPLRDEGLDYARRLEEAGVAVETSLYPGAAHGFWWMDAALSQAAELTSQLARILRRPTG